MWGKGCDAGLRKEEADADSQKRGVDGCFRDLEWRFPEHLAVLPTVL